MLHKMLLILTVKLRIAPLELRLALCARHVSAQSISFANLVCSAQHFLLALGNFKV